MVSECEGKRQLDSGWIPCVVGAKVEFIGRDFVYVEELRKSIELEMHASSMGIFNGREAF